MSFVPLVDPPDAFDAPPLWFCVGRGDVLLVDGEELSPELAVAADSTLFLGLFQGRPCWAAAMPPSTGDGFVPLMALYGRVEEPLWTLAGRAVQLVEWERTHRFCGRCGAETVQKRGERARECPSCRLLAFPRIAPAVITVVRRGDRMLLARNRMFPPGLYSAIAGFVEPGETLEDAVRREVFEEVAVEVGHVRYVGSQPWPFPHSLMLGFFGEWVSGEISCDGTEIAEADWFPADQLPNVPGRMSIARMLIDATVDELTR